MAKRTIAGPTAERFVEATLALIAEHGGSRDVNLREVSRRLGFAHTNVYNYFASFEDLLWAAFRRTLEVYGDRLTGELDPALRPAEYLERLITALVAFPQEQPGWYRFIGSDPVARNEFPADILDTVTAMKRWLNDTFKACSPGADGDEAETAASIILAYVDGETLNLINGRVVPGEDVGGRIVDNALRLFTLLLGEPRAATAESTPYPQANWETAEQMA